MKRGTIVLTKFPFTDLSSAKRRPGIIVSGKSSDKQDTIVAFISSVIPHELEDTDYLISTYHKDFPVTGLKKESVVKLNKLATINSSVISGEIGVASEDTMAQIDERLKLALGLK